MNKHRSDQSGKGYEDEDVVGYVAPVPKLPRLEDTRSPDSDGEVEKEMFEAEGQLNLNLGELEQAQDVTSAEEHLHTIWKKLGLDRNGYIVQEELEKVCDHIGMEKMDEEELQQLFDKLDSNKDGKVSFNDFIVGLFQHNTVNPNRPGSRVVTPRVMTPRTSSAQKKVKAPSAANEDRTTPSVISTSGVSGLFSVLDPDHTGFAMPDDIIDLWENYHVTNGADVLVALGFDLVTKINLAQLSGVLEEEMMNTEDNNAVYQAAFVSFQQEIQYIKNTTEQQTWAIEKLKQDLSEANSRNALLAKEVDERHYHIEQSNEKKLMSIEKKYQDQVKTLQTELDHEREQYSSQTALHKSKLAIDMEQLKQEEGKLRTNLVYAQKEIEKLEKELGDTTDKLTENVKQNTRLQKELEKREDMERKLEEYENTGLLSPEQHKYTRDELQKTKSENKVLKDMADELKAEVDSLKLQMHIHNKSEHLSNKFYDMGSRIPIREGSFLSDYVKTKRGVRSSVSSENSEDEGLSMPNHPGRVRRRLPIAPEDDDTCSVSSIQSDRDYVEVLKKEITDLKIHYEREKKDLELDHRNAIIKLEEKAASDREELNKKHKDKMDALAKDNDAKTLSALQEQQKRLEANFAKEKEKLLRQHQEEKDAIEREHNRKQQELLQKTETQLKQSHKGEMQNMESKLAISVQEVLALKREKTDMEEELIFQKEETVMNLEREKEVLKDELDQTLASTESAIKQLEKEKLELQLQIEDINDSFSVQKDGIIHTYESEIRKLKSKLEEYEQMLIQGESGLKGKLRKDFYALLDEHKKSIVAEQRDESLKHMHKEKLTMEKNYADQRKELDKSYEKEKERIIRQYESQLESLRRELWQHDNELDKERESLAKEYADQKAILEEELSTAIKEELEDEFVRQMEVLKDSFESEKYELQEQVRLLQQELEDSYRELSKEAANRKKIEELNATISLMQKDKLMAEKTQSELQTNLQMTKVAMETRIAVINDEKEGAINAIQAEFVQSAKESGKQKAALDAALRENTSLEAKLAQIQEDVSKATHCHVTEITQMQEKFDTLQKEKSDLQEKVSSLQHELEEFKTTKIPPHAQSVIKQLEERNISLENTISSTEHKLIDVENRVTKLTKRQDDYKPNRTYSISENLQAKLDGTSDELRKEKETLMALQLEKSRLEQELQKVKDKLMEASKHLALLTSQRRSSSPRDVENFTRLQIDLVDQQRQLRELQDFIETKDNEKSRKLKAKEDELKKAIEKLEEEKEELSRKLRLLQELLNEQLEKIKSHYDECDKRNILVVDLYKENADLMEALYLMEDRKKDAVSRCYRLEDQCRALRLMVKKVCHVAIS